jgi:predicted DNA binding CopG/RHH family protein
MKKKKNSAKVRKSSPAETKSQEALRALQFIEDYKKLVFQKDEPTKAISVRIPAQLLRMLKAEAEQKGVGYQTHLVQILRGYFLKPK